MNSGLAKKMPLRSGDFRRILRPNLGALGKGDALGGACVPALQRTFFGGVSVPCVVALSSLPL